MADFTITVVGTGVIGTSLGLALKQTEEPLRLVAHDKDLAIAKNAVKSGAFDKAEWNLINACEQASLIVLAIPLNGIRPTLEAIGPYLQKGAVVTDVCRSKTPVLAAAQTLLPEHVHFVGGDPIVYPLNPGHENATPDLFRQCLYCLTPAVSAHEEAVRLLVNFVNLVGGTPFFLDAEEHDGLVAATEYLPAMLSAALVQTLANQASWRETRKLAGRLFEQVSAGVEGNPDGLKDGVLSHRATILAWLDQYLTQLGELRSLIAEADETGEALARAFDQAVVERHNWLTDARHHRLADNEALTAPVETTGFLRRLIGFGR
jgi:prephenate dehydrogenase